MGVPSMSLSNVRCPRCGKESRITKREPESKIVCGICGHEGEFRHFTDLKTSTHTGNRLVWAKDAER